MTTNPSTTSTDLRCCTAFAPTIEPAAGANVANETSDFAALAHVSLRPVLLDLSHIAQSHVEHLRERDPDRKVEVIVHHGMRVTGDATLLPEALTQLIDNAWAALAATRDAWIEVGTRLGSDRERQFYVADNGAGFDRETAGKPFEPPMSRYLEQSCPGHGRGLARAARIVRRHGGRLDGDSAPGKGAEFYFTVATDAAAATAA